MAGSKLVDVGPTPTALAIHERNTMILRIVFVVALVILFVVPIYRLLLKRTTRVKSELESSDDAEQQLEELKTKTKNLKAECAEQERSAKKKAEQARKVRSKL